jgi:hypothetical protein
MEIEHIVYFVTGVMSALFTVAMVRMASPRPKYPYHAKCKQPGCIFRLAGTDGELVLNLAMDHSEEHKQKEIDVKQLG